MSVFYQLSINTRNALIISNNLDELKVLCANLDIEQCLYTNLPVCIQEQAKAYLSEYNTLIASRISLLQSSPENPDRPQQEIQLKLQGIRVDIAFLHAQQNQGLPVADDSISKLYASIQLLITHLSTLEPAQHKPFLYDLRNALYLAHKVTENQIQRDTTQEARTLYTYSLDNHNFLTSLEGLDELESSLEIALRASKFNFEISGLKQHIYAMNDSPRKTLYVNYLISIQDAYRCKTSKGVTLPTFFFAVMKHFCNKTVDTPDKSDNRIAEINAMLTHFTLDEQEKQILLDLRTAIEVLKRAHSANTIATSSETTTSSPFEPISREGALQ
ncbi:MAG: hypothetical protein P0S94_00740 [Simkaniaceae bacterium]|nr:hypothetical protein [Simkaniaceae bacterium]